MDGNLNVILKEGQSIWPEWTGENSATDVAGNDFDRVDGVWYPAGDTPAAEAAPDEAAAA